MKGTKKTPTEFTLPPIITKRMKNKLTITIKASPSRFVISLLADGNASKTSPLFPCGSRAQPVLYPAGGFINKLGGWPAAGLHSRCARRQEADLCAVYGAGGNQRRFKTWRVKFVELRFQSGSVDSRTMLTCRRRRRALFLA